MPLPTNLVEAREEVAEKRDRLARIFEEMGPNRDTAQITSIQGDSDYKVAQIQRLNRELADLGQNLERLEGLEHIRRNNELEQSRMVEPAQAMSFPGSPGSGLATRPKGFRDVMDQSKQLKQLIRGETREAAIELPMADFKTLITLTTISPQTSRRPGIEEMPFEDRTISDMMLQGQTDRPVAEYYEETTFDPLNATTGANIVAEGAAKPEGEFAYTLRTENVRKIAWWVPATEESFADNDFLESQIRGRLAFGVRRREEQQLIAGSGAGSPTQLRGLLNRVGIQTTAKTAGLPIPDVIYTAMQLIRGSAGTGFAEPTGVIFHPTNWLAVKLLRTADGIYIWGPPSEEGPDRIWGLSVRQTTAMTLNTALVGAFRPHAEVLRRTGINIIMSTEHASYAVENKVALIAEERLALAVYRPSAFCTATALNA